METSMTPRHRQWKKPILTGGALCAAWWPCPPFTWDNSISLALILCNLTWTTPHGLNVTSAIPPFIYSVQPGNLFKLSDPNVFFAHSFVVGSFRYPQITLKKARNLSIAHAMGTNPTVIGSWFTLLEKIKKTAGITSPDQIWSGDETGVQNVPKEVKVLGLKNIRCFQQVSAKQGETSTILSFISAAGTVVPPMVLHKGVRVQDTWKLKAPGDIKIAVTPKGYITKSHFHKYGLHFVKYLKQMGLTDKIDGHKSHLYNLPFYEAMRANNIEVLTIPPHTSHVLQPLDSVPFTQFKRNWESNLRKYNSSHSG